MLNNTYWIPSRLSLMVITYLFMKAPHRMTPWPWQCMPLTCYLWSMSWRVMWHRCGTPTMYLLAEELLSCRNGGTGCSPFGHHPYPGKACMASCQAWTPPNTWSTVWRYRSQHHHTWSEAPGIKAIRWRICQESQCLDLGDWVPVRHWQGPTSVSICHPDPWTNEWMDCLDAHNPCHQWPFPWSDTAKEADALKPTMPKAKQMAMK